LDYLYISWIPGLQEFVVEETIMIDSIHGPPRHTVAGQWKESCQKGHVSPGRLEIQLYGQRVLLDVLDRLSWQR
jgi:hypothetical protein